MGTHIAIEVKILPKHWNTQEYNKSGLRTLSSSANAVTIDENVKMLYDLFGRKNGILQEHQCVWRLL
jgi:hypothetical protein